MALSRLGGGFFWPQHVRQAMAGEPCSVQREVRIWIQIKSSNVSPYVEGRTLSRDEFMV